MIFGRYDVVILLSFIEGFMFDGLVGYVVRKLVYLIRLLMDEYRFKVGVSWFVKFVVELVVLF